MAVLLTEFAPAKLNLYLHILGRDQRGYHLLDSLVAFADVGDALTVEAAEEFSLTIDGPFGAGLEAGEDNLITRAARGVASLAGKPLAFKMTLTKSLPIASGIGGGSADAAATLRALCRLWDIDPAGKLIMSLAQALGSDVPVCVASTARFMGGVGETLDPCPALPEAWLVLANPNLPCPTAAVFAARAGPFAPDGRFDVAPGDAAELAQILERRGNGLAAAAIGVRPEIGDVLTALEATADCLLARMLGSGATCLGLYATKPAAMAAEARLRLSRPVWWVAAGRLIDGPSDRGPQNA